MSQPQGSFLGNVCDPGSPTRAIARGIFDLLRSVTDHDANLGDAGLDNGLDDPEEDRLVGYRHQLLGTGVGDRIEASAFTPTEH